MFSQLCDIVESDIWYNALPLYHSSGGMVAAGNLLINGTPQVIRKKFSASKYFEDCAKYNATVRFQLLLELSSKFLAAMLISFFSKISLSFFKKKVKHDSQK